MSARKMMALAGTLLIAAAGLALAQESQSTEANKVQVKTRVETQAQARTQAQPKVRTRVRTQFVDQNGDGINDLYRDHDNDGIPNCQDSDWAPPQNGTGYKSGQGSGKAGAAAQAGNRQGFLGKAGFSNRSFRNGLAGTCLCCPGCDGTGPKGRIVRGGRG
jgi:hypothetical protein